MDERFIFAADPIEVLPELGLNVAPHRFEGGCEILVLRPDNFAIVFLHL